MVCQHQNLRDDFEDVFPSWVRAIITYCQESHGETEAIKDVLKHVSTHVVCVKYL